MTMQRMERFQYRGEDYELAAIEGFDGFHLPEPLRRLPFREPDTALHRGFVTTFSLNARHQLIVHSIDAWVSPEAAPPEINGIAPILGYRTAAEEESEPSESEPSESESPESAPAENGPSEESRSQMDMILEMIASPADHDAGKTGKRSGLFSFPKKIAYHAIDVPLSYSGRMLIGRDPLPYLLGGYVPPFYYQKVLELRFSDGYLIGVSDVSAEANDILQSIAAQTKEIENDPEHRLIAVPMYAFSEYSLDLDERWTDRVIVFSDNAHEEALDADDAAEPEPQKTGEDLSSADMGDWGAFLF